MLGLQSHIKRYCFPVGMNLYLGKRWVLNTEEKMFTLIGKKGCFSLHLVPGEWKKEITYDTMKLML